MYTIPNDSFAGTPRQRAQATPSQTDIDILVAGYALTGVVSGCAVAAQASPNMTVAVAAGRAALLGSLVTVAGNNVTIAPNAGATPRMDLIVLDGAGAATVVAGTPGATPVAPPLPASRIGVGLVYVAAGAAAIGNLDLVDKRVPVPSQAVLGFVDHFSLGSGALAVGVYEERLRTFVADIVVLGVSAVCGFGWGPVGSNVMLDFIVGDPGVSLWNLFPANRPKILDGAEDTGGEIVPDTTSVLASTSLRPKVVSIGSGSPGSFCVINLRWRWA